MSLSILKLLTDTRRADLIAALTRDTSLSTETAGKTIDALLPTAISHLVAANQTGGVEKALSLLSNESADANWPALDRTAVASHLTQDLGISADHAKTAIEQVITATKSEVTGLLAHHSLNDVLKAQPSFLEGLTPEWGFSLNGLTDMAGKGLGSVGALGAAAVAGVAGAAALASDKAGDLLNGAGNLVGGAADKAGDLLSGAGNLVGGAADKAADLAGDAANAIGGVATGAVDKAGELGGAAISTGAAAVGAVGAGLSNVIGGVSTSASKVGSSALNAADSAVSTGSSIFRKLLPLLALLLLAALALFGYKACKKADTATTEVAAPVAEVATPAVAALTPALFALQADANGGAPTITATVGTEEGKLALIEAIKAKYGQEAADKAVITIDPAYDNNFPADLVDASATAMPDVAAVVANSVTATTDALSKLVPGTSTTDDLVNALNLNIINFATGKSDIPADNQAVLKNAANVITQMKASLNVTGHTDNTGDEAANVKLSQARAEAVKAFLVANGVDANALTASGVGSSAPKVGNDTAADRFTNRRIEFSAK